MRTNRGSKCGSLEEKSENLSSGVLLFRLLMINDTIRSGQDNMTELTGGEKICGPFVDLKIDQNLTERNQGHANSLVYLFIFVKYSLKHF